MSKDEQKIRKKLQKQQYKLEKKQLEAGSDANTFSHPSFYVRFAESIKGVLYIILAASIFAAVIMGQSGLIVTLEDIIDSLIIARLGKVLITVIAIALFIYGLKNLRILK
jgi:small neutral amino acid transporter SnatA (MarC family)